MRQHTRRLRQVLALVLIGCLTAGAAGADWTSPTANATAYEAQYAEAAEAYKSIRYGAESARVAAVKEALATLGYFPYQPNNNYNRTLQRALRLFVTQMRIGGDGEEITPLMQAMLEDADSLPRAISPAISLSEYTSDTDASGYTPYTFTRLSRSGVQQSTKVGFQGRIVGWAVSANVYHYVVEMDDNPERHVYVRYEPLPRTTVYQPGDLVAVFGVTQGEQSLPHDGMDTPALLVHADRVGYAP